MSSTMSQFTAVQRLTRQWRRFLMWAVVLGLVVLLARMGSRPQLWLTDAATPTGWASGLILASGLLHVVSIAAYMFVIAWFSRVVFQPGWMTFIYCVFAWFGGILWWFPVLGLYWAYARLRRMYLEDESMPTGLAA